MQSSNIPAKIPLPFAYAAGPSYKNTIPTASQIGITNGKASLTDGFPPLTFDPLSAGGVPPFGADFNGILNEITAIQQWQEAGGFFPFDATFASAIGGYPAGAIIQSSSKTGLWLSTIENNSNNPDTGGAGWSSLAFEGSQSISVTSSDITVTQLQAAYPVIIASGAKTAARNLIFPAAVGEWIVQNNTTGAYTLTAKTASGTGVTLTQGESTYIYCDGTNIYFADSAKVASFNGRVGAVTLTATDVTDAIGYIPGNIIYTGSYANTIQYNNTTTTLTASQAGSIIISGGGGNAFTLPLTTTVPLGAVFAIFGQGGSTTVSSQGGEHIGVGSNNSGTTVSLLGSEFATFANAGGNWVVTNGTPMLPGSGMFASSLTLSGYQKLPGGLIIQWGLNYGVGGAPNTASATYSTVYFPITFPNGVFSVTCNPQDTYGSNDQMSTPLVYVGSTAYFNYGNTDLDTGIGNYRWIAVGY